MTIINATKARSEFSSLLRRADKGHPTAITKGGEVYAVLVPKKWHDLAELAIQSTGLGPFVASEGIFSADGAKDDSP